jgi:hypothetical protein
MTPHPLRNRYVRDEQSLDSPITELGSPDDYHDSEKINSGMRDVSRRTAHAAAMERAIASLMSQTPMEVDQIGRLTLRDLPEGTAKAALLRRRFDIGLSNCPNSRVLVDDAESAGAVSAVTNTRTPSILAP